MTEVLTVVLIVLVAAGGFTAGRLHGQAGYRLGYRNGYRQGHLDGDRSSWNRRRRELQAAVASVLSTPASLRRTAYPPPGPVGTTYVGQPAGESPAEGEETAGRHARALVNVSTEK